MTKSEDNENKIIAQRYANALIEFADENLSKESIFEQISDIQKSLNNSDELMRLMSSPVISGEEKKKVLNDIFKDTHQIVRNFLNLLVDRSRFSILSSIIKEYKSILDKSNNIMDIKITSAIDLNESEKAMIKVKLQRVLNKEIDLEWSVNEEIIGGLIFEADDNIIDCSLQHKLQEIQKKITL